MEAESGTRHFASIARQVPYFPEFAIDALPGSAIEDCHGAVAAAVAGFLGAPAGAITVSMHLPVHATPGRTSNACSPRRARLSFKSDPRLSGWIDEARSMTDPAEMAVAAQGWQQLMESARQEFLKIRSEAVHELRGRGWTFGQIAKRLGISRAHWSPR